MIGALRSLSANERTVLAGTSETHSCQLERFGDERLGWLAASKKAHFPSEAADQLPIRLISFDL